MGFWSTVGGLAKGAADSMAVTAAKAEVLAEEYREEDTDYLKRKVKDSRSMVEKMAAAKVLKERGVVLVSRDDN